MSLHTEFEHLKKWIKDGHVSFTDKDGHIRGVKDIMIFVNDKSMHLYEERLTGVIIKDAKTITKVKP